MILRLVYATVAVASLMRAVHWWYYADNARDWATFVGLCLLAALSLALVGYQPKNDEGRSQV